MPYSDKSKSKEYFRKRYLKQKQALELSGKVFRVKRPKAATDEERLERTRARARASAKRNIKKMLAYQKRRYNKNGQFKLSKCVRAVMTRAFRRLASGKKSASSIELLGCSIEELKIHIQSKFKAGMSWGNYGYRTWHIDHIKPICSFNLFDPEQQRLAFSFTNLQPLWWHENLAKSGRHVKMPVRAVKK